MGRREETSQARAAGGKCNVEGSEVAGSVGGGSGCWERERRKARRAVEITCHPAAVISIASPSELQRSMRMAAGSKGWPRCERRNAMDWRESSLRRALASNNSRAVRSCKSEGMSSCSRWKVSASQSRKRTEWTGRRSWAMGVSGTRAQGRPSGEQQGVA